MEPCGSCGDIGGCPILIYPRCGACSWALTSLVMQGDELVLAFSWGLIYMGVYEL